MKIKVVSTRVKEVAVTFSDKEILEIVKSYADTSSVCPVINDLVVRLREVLRHD